MQILTGSEDERALALCLIIFEVKVACTFT